MRANCEWKNRFRVEVDTQKIVKQLVEQETTIQSLTSDYRVAEHTIDGLYDKVETLENEIKSLKSALENAKTSEYKAVFKYARLQERCRKRLKAVAAIVRAKWYNRFWMTRQLVSKLESFYL